MFDPSFRMSVSDFRQNFEVMEVCHLTECLGEPDSSVLPWSTVMHHGTWVPRITAGGAPHHSKTPTDGMSGVERSLNTSAAFGMRLKILPPRAV